MKRRTRKLTHHRRREDISRCNFGIDTTLALMGNYLILKKLLEGKLFLFWSPQSRVKNKMKLNEMENVATRNRDNKETVERYKKKIFSGSSLVDQMCAKGVYFCSFVAKSNPACTKYSSKCIQQFS